jgi:ABC-type multidrug transport system permease subunit
MQREPRALRVRIAMIFFFAVLIDFIFWQVGEDQPSKITQSSIQNTVGAMFMVVFMQFMSNMFSNLLTFQLERPVFLREYANQMYSITPYYLTKMAVEIPILFIAPMIMQLLTFWAIGFKNTQNAFWMMYFTAAMCCQSASALGFMVSALANGIVEATMMGPIFIMPISLFGGLLVNLQSVFVWLRWI